MKKRASALTVSTIFAAAALTLHTASGQETILPSPQAGPLDIKLRTDTGRDVNLRMETQYSTQDLGRQLTDEQIEKLDSIRSEAPDKYQILSALFPRQIAEFLLRTPSANSSPVAPADDAVQRLVWEIASDYISRPESGAYTAGQLHARADFIRTSLETLPAQPAPIQRLLEDASREEDPDFNSPDKANTFLVLKNWYSPYKSAGMSVIGDTLTINGSVVTNQLAATAAAAGQSPEQYANNYYARYQQAITRWRSAQITGDAYAGTVRRFLNDPRLAEFTPEEVSRAYERVFGRNLKTDLEADRMAARVGHPVTYNELHAQSQKE